MGALAIFAAALSVRLIHLWQIRKAPFFDVLMGDSRGYDEWAERLARGEWIGRDVFYQAPLYPYFLGVIYAIAGRSVLVVRVMQAILGSLSCVLVGSAARLLFSPAAGLIAGLMLAFYAPAIFFDGLLQKSTLDVFFVSLALYCIARIATGEDASRVASVKAPRTAPVARDRAMRWWWYLGFTIGGLTLTRENAIVFVVVIAVWAVIRAGAKAGVAFALAVAIIIAPVAIRNSLVGGGLYLTTSQFGPNLFIGNHPGADGSYQSLRYGRGAPEYERQDATELAERALHRPLTPDEVSTYWADRAIDFMTSQPAAWLRLMGRKVVLLWNAAEMVDTEDQATHADWSLPLRILGPIGHFGVLVPLAAIGLFATWRNRRQLWIVYALVGAYGLSVVLFYVFARYRYPLVPMLIVLAAGGVARFRATCWNARHVAAVAAILTFTNWPVVAARDMRAVTELNLGAALQTDDRLDDAIAHYRRSIALRPDYAPAYNNLATALRSEKKVAEAQAAYGRALQLEPRFASAHYNLANLLLDQGDAPAAVTHFEQALEVEPASADVHNNLGIALTEAGRVEDAVAEFRTAIELDPGSAMAYRNLGDALSTLGRAEEAMTALRKAAELEPSNASAHYDLGVDLLQSGRLDEAVREFRAALAIAPQMVEAHNNLGIALGSEGKMDEAITEFRRALELKPDFEDARKNLAMALKDGGRAGRGARR